MEKDQHIRQLFEKYIARSCNSEELDQLLAYLDDDIYEEELLALISAEMERDAPSPSDPEVLSITQNAEQRIFERTRRRQFHLSTFAKIAIAAALLFGLAIFLILGSRTNRNVKTYSDGDISVLAGTDRAILSLSDGRKIALGKTANLNLAVEDGTRIVQGKNGQITYQGSSTEITGNAENQLEVPNGGSFR